jgi:hypothetical protein
MFKTPALHNHNWKLKTVLLRILMANAERSGGGGGAVGMNFWVG